MMPAGWPAALAAAALALVCLPPAPARAAETLTVCLDEDIPIYSEHHGGQGRGFMLAVSEAVAKRLERPLKVQWFETKVDPDDSSVLGANALLSDGRCQLVGGYPLVRDALGRPGIGTARLPDFDGATLADRRRRIALGSLVPTRAFNYAPITLVTGPAATKPVAGLADLKGIKLGTEAATLADAILMLYDDGALVDRITHLVPGRNELLPRLEKGEFEAALVDLRRLDAYRAEHPDTRIKPTGYYYRIGFNMGFVGLDTEAGLIAEVDRALDDLLAQNAIAPLAASVGMTYLPPRQPEILEHLTLRDLREE
jgi:ABC-type amino acid transport substrate-binding protein